MRPALAAAVLVLVPVLASCAGDQNAGLRAARCGDGVRQGAEACDDGDANSDTEAGACRTSCVLPSCGDGVVDAGEGCDAGTANGGEGATCLADCVLPGCGNGRPDPGEGCDDGEANSDTAPDACRTTCRRAFCGDGVRDAAEGCDEGEAKSDRRPDACRRSCTTAHCGDGVVDAGEACDGGAGNHDDVPDACRSTCVEPSCGDGTIDGDETCDEGASNSDTAPGACRTTCVRPACGDGVIDPGELCDDGPRNGRQADACREDCSPARCGDGARDTGEACDAGASASDTRPDACRTDCRLPSCGDGVTDSNELCDDGAANSASEPDACRPICEPPTCGDGVRDRDEACDDGNFRSRDGCDAACALESHTCGNQVIEVAEDCDDGNATSGDGCGPDCLREIPATCLWSTNGIVDLRAAGTFDGDNGYYYDGTTEGAPSMISFCAGVGTGPEVFHAYPVPVSGDLVADLTVPDGGQLVAALALNDGSDGTCPGTTRECALGDLRPGGARQAIHWRVEAGDLYYVVVDSKEGFPGPYSLHVRMLPALPLGAPCQTANSTGVCDRIANLACADADGDGLGTCVPVAPRFGACDPARIANLCEPDQWCSPAGVCLGQCGNGTVDGTEPCDDGNRVDTDNCSNLCVDAGRSCTRPLDFTLQWDPAARSATWSPRNFLLATGQTSSCGGPALIRDFFGTFTAPAAGTFVFRITPPAPVATAISLRDACGAPASERACAASTGPGTAALVRTLAAGETVSVLAEAAGLPPGRYELAVEQVECGDGHLAYGEECDDGNRLDGDNCSSRCVAAGGSCAAPWVLSPGAPSWSGTFDGAQAGAGPSCEPASTAVRFAIFTAPGAGTWAFTATGADGLSVTDACGTAERACTAWPAALPALVSLPAGGRVVLQLSGATAPTGRFQLTGVQVVCGDGSRQPSEECDDGNVAPGDGCDGACRTEHVEAEPNDLRSQANPIGVGTQTRGSLTGYDQDTFAFQATAGTTYVAETFAGEVGACTVAGGKPMMRIRIHDSTGFTLADDGQRSGVDDCSKAVFRPTVSGKVWVRVQYGIDARPTPIDITPYFLDLRSAP
jgi:cysteine-rich repeat protein